MKFRAEFTGELIGTFILVFFGCSAVAVNVLYSAHVGLFQVAAIWGGGLTLAIYVTRHLSDAHFNPAVSLAMIVGKRMPLVSLPVYLIGQFSGAFLAAAVLYMIFSGSITEYEAVNSIVRGSPESVTTAMMFGEFYPNPGAGVSFTITTMNAFLAEAAGTFLLAFFILALTDRTNNGKPDDALTPVFIGLTLAVIIGIIAPLTQAGLNPARDLAPRIFAYLAGWQKAAMPDEHYGFLSVYVLGPIIGGVLASVMYTNVVGPLMNKTITK
jgi:glycerol uptake facilitator protein